MQPFRGGALSIHTTVRVIKILHSNLLKTLRWHLHHDAVLVKIMSMAMPILFLDPTHLPSIMLLDYESAMSRNKGAFSYCAFDDGNSTSSDDLRSTDASYHCRQRRALPSTQHQQQFRKLIKSLAIVGKTGLIIPITVHHFVGADPLTQAHLFFLAEIHGHNHFRQRQKHDRTDINRSIC